MTGIEKRLNDLERALLPDDDLPPYLALTAAQFEALQAELDPDAPPGGPGIKAYCTISPDDWDLDWPEVTQIDSI